MRRPNGNQVLAKTFDFRYELMPNGNLLIIAMPETREELREKIAKGYVDWWPTLFEGLVGNGWHYVSPEAIGAMTDAPIVSDDVTFDDDGTITDVGRLWWFPNYQVTDPIEELVEDGQVVFQRAPEERENRRRNTSTRTPWGRSQHVTTYAPGIDFHSTAGHGGIHLSRERQAQMPPALRLRGGWYEEDVDWARVAFVFPQFFKPEQVETAEAMLRDWLPDEYEAVTGQAVSTEASRIKREREFHRRHEQDYVVTSAQSRSSFSPNIPEDMVGVIATRGGRRTEHAERRGFLVPKDEYAGRDEFGFVVDPDRHRPW